MHLSSPRILLLGGGYSLGRLASLLPAHSFVITARRQERLHELLNAGFNAVPLIAEDCASLRHCLDTYPTLEVVVDSIPPQPNDATHVVRIATEVIRSQASIKRVIYLSTTGVYGVEDGSEVTEDRPLEPRHDRARARMACEQAYIDCGKELCIVRLPAIYGPGRGIGIALQQRRYCLVGMGDRYTNRIHVDDLARALQHTIESASPLPRVMHIADDEPAKAKEVVAYYCRTFSLQPPQSISEDQARSENLHFFLANQRISNRLLKEKFRFTLTYPSFRLGAATEFSAPRFPGVAAVK